MPETLYDKIWNEHVVHRQDNGTILLYVDRHLIHEVTSPQAFEGLRLSKRKVRKPNLTLAVADHNVPTTDRSKGINDRESKIQVEELEKNCREFGVELFDMKDKRQGIVHIIGPEQGFTQPGTVIVCGDSHTATHGAFGALAFGIGTSEVEHVLATQTLIQKKSKNFCVKVTGKLPTGVTSKDVILQTIGKIGTAGGNGSRCAAYLLMKESNNKKISLRTRVGILQAKLNGRSLVSINMGQPNFEWSKIPLSKKMDNQNLEIKINSIDGKEVIGGFSLSIGNPHVIFFVEDFNQFNLKEIGPKIENHSYFPEKCNVTLANVKNRKHVKVKVWERGAGLTKACGTAACAAAVSGAVLKLNERCVDIEFPQGLLNIDWKKDNNIYMTGKVSEVKKITVNI